MRPPPTPTPPTPGAGEWEPPRGHVSPSRRHAPGDLRTPSPAGTGTHGQWRAGPRGLWLSAPRPPKRTRLLAQNMHPGTWLRNAGPGGGEAGSRVHPSSLRSGNDALLGSHTHPLMGAGLGWRGRLRASGRGRVDVLVLERGRRVSPEGEVTERVRAGEVRGVAPLQQREHVVNHLTEPHVPAGTGPGHRPPKPGVAPGAEPRTPG